MSKHGGAIVNMLADMWGGMPGMGHSAPRAGMDNLTKTAAFEWGYAGVRVNAVAPGWIASSGMDTYEGAFKAVIPTLREHVPLKRIGTESEVSAAIVFLLSPAAAFISGSTLRIDGAASAAAPGRCTDTAASESYNGFHRAYLPDVLKDKE
jgi:citronellol/citronellal dehydrogenase